MNSSLTTLLLSEVGFLAFLGLVIYVWSFWKQNKKQAIELENLLNELTCSEPARKALLLKHLALKRHMQADTAARLSEQLIASERQFLQFFINYRLVQTSGKDFYAHLINLLDFYLSA
jgi:hypothetical protein